MNCIFTAVKTLNFARTLSNRFSIPFQHSSYIMSGGV